jgi:hypothetical protein
MGTATQYTLYFGFFSKKLYTSYLGKKEVCKIQRDLRATWLHDLSLHVVSH